MSEGDYVLVLDAKVGQRLERMAAARGVSARNLVTAMIDLSDEDTSDAGGDDAAPLGELKTQWAEVEAGTEPVVSNDDVRKWLSTWGTSEFKPWSANSR